MKIIKDHKFIIYPYFLGLYSLLNTVAANIFDIPPSQAFRALLCVIFTTSLLLIIAFFITKNWHRATLISALAVFLIFSYGQIYLPLKNNTILGFNAGQHYILLPILILIISIIVISFFKVSITRYERFSNLLLVVTTFALIFPSINITLPYLFSDMNRFSGWKPDNGSTTLILDKISASKNKTPDIYYIVLDGYGRKDTLNEIFAFDNSMFLDFLEDRGFYIAENSHTNYLQTAPSLASSLNFEYLTYLSEIGANSANREPFKELIRHSSIRVILEKYGYRFITFDSGYAYTEIKDADLFIGRFIRTNDFEELFLTSSIAILLDNNHTNSIPLYTYSTHRKRLLYSIEQLRIIPQVTGPKFVFAHLVIPHPPFVFDKQGNPITYQRAYDIHDANLFKGSRSEYIKGYTEQIVFTNNQIENIVDSILQTSSSPPIIIIQGDHGPRMLINWDSLEDSCIKEAASILNAFYLPGKVEEELYSSISPVNSFRVILNRYFDTDLNLLEDKTYFSNFSRPYNFVDVTDNTELPCLESSSDSSSEY